MQTDAPVGKTVLTGFWAFLTPISGILGAQQAVIGNLGRIHPSPCREKSTLVHSRTPTDSRNYSNACKDLALEATQKSW
jgi:hypothetical protein